MYARDGVVTLRESPSTISSLVLPLFHTGHESPELPRIDFLLIRGDS